MKDPKTIEMLESIPKFKSYSKYNTSLEKIFKDNCLKNLIYSLKYPRKATRQGILEEITKKSQEEDDDNFLMKKLNLKIDEPSLLDDTNENIIPKSKKNFNTSKYHTAKKSSPIPLISKLKTFHEYQKKKLKLYKPNLDPFKYSPNYNSIYKNTYCVKIQPDTNNKNKTEYVNSFDTILTGSKYSNLYNSNKNSFTKYNKKNLRNLKEKIKIIDNMNEKNDSIILSNKNDLKKNNDNFYNKNNHSIRFSKCTPRKNNINFTSKIVSYIQPYDYKSNVKNKTIDFNKMLARSHKILINVASLKVPSACYYSPKYNLLEQKPMSIIFNEEANIKRKNNKKYLLQKLWSSYDAKQEYQLVDNKKLDDNILKYLSL